MASGCVRDAFGMCLTQIGKRIRDACIYPYKINVAQYYP